MPTNNDNLKEHKRRTIERRLSRGLPEGIEQDVADFFHPELGLVISFQDAMFQEITPNTNVAKFEARKRFIAWWNERERFIERTTMEPKASQLLLMDKLGENKTEPMLDALISRLQGIKEEKFG